MKFGLRPNAGSGGPHVPLRAERECEFRRVVAVRSIDDDQEIALAGREVDLLDLNSHFLGQVLSGFGALGSILDRADSLVGPVQQTHKRRHGILRVITPQRLPTAAEAAVDLWGVKRDGDAKKKRRSSKRSCPPTALSLRVDPNGISARSVTKGQLIKTLHRSPSRRKAGERRNARAVIRRSNPRSLRGSRSSLGSVQISWQSGG